MNPHVCLLTPVFRWLAGMLMAVPLSAALQVEDPLCEYLRDPLGIDVRQPRFSWKLADPDHERGQRQTAYHLKVESSGGGKPPVVLWDSGRVESDESVNVEYAGAALPSNQDCTWKVMVWDKDGKPGEWSRPARFSMGLLEPTDWKGEWIHHPKAAETDHVWFRKNFTLDEIPSGGFLYLASIGYHELYVNGERMGTRVLAPAVTNLQKRALYITYDLRGKLRKGDNVIAVWMGPGWARSDGSFNKGVWKQDWAFKCQINLADGKSMHTDTEWKCQTSSSGNLGPWKGGGQGEYGGEWIDARRHLPDWNQPGFDDAAWAKATVIQKSVILSAEMLEPDRKVETLKPVSLTEKDGQYTFDMGRNFTGWLEFKLRNGKEGEVVKFMTANRAGLVVEFGQESHYTHDASGQGTFSHRFNYMAGRWITVAGLSYRPELEDLKCYIVTNDRRRFGAFECSNPLFNQIYETDLRTYIANSVNGVTMDCPHRERFGYGEIALACTWGCAIPNFESAAYYRKVARDWFDVQREDGFVNTIAPHTYKGAGGTLWSSAPVTMSWEYYKAYGDRRQLAEAYHPMKRWLDYLHKSVSPEGVLTAYESPSRFLGDWATPHGSESGNTPEAKLFNNCVYAYCLDVMVKAARILGHPEDENIYAARLAALRTSAHKHFFNPEAGHYIDGRQLAMAFPLYTGITPEKERERVMKKFVEEISVRKPYLDTGSSGLPILLKFLVEDAERADLLFPILAKKSYPGYGYFLASGETTWPEYWKIEGEPSRIHTCYTGIAGYFVKSLGGIQSDPEAPGMKRFLIKPKLVGELTHARTTSGSMYGKIGSNWMRDGTKADFFILIPPNTSAKVFIPAKELEHITESGKSAAQSPGLRSLGRIGGDWVFEVGAGVYQFTSSSAPLDSVR